MGQTETQILLLLNEGTSFTLSEIAEHLVQTPKIVGKSLRRLFETGLIRCDLTTRRYMLAKDE